MVSAANFLQKKRHARFPVKPPVGGDPPLVRARHDGALYGNKKTPSLKKTIPIPAKAQRRAFF
jgi:hypothetical protein